VDREGVGHAHPAFFSVITQMAPDELIFLHDFASRNETLIMSPTGQKVYPDLLWRKSRLDKCDLRSDLEQQIENDIFKYETLIQPELFPVYQEHLQHLGLIEYSNRLSRHYDAIGLKTSDDGDLSLFSMRLTHFGRLFLKACVNQIDDLGNSSGR